MGLISKTKTWADNENVAYTDLNADFDTLYNEFNGNIDNNNIKAGAAIDRTKIGNTALTLTDTQTVINKTMTDTSNNLLASSLKTTGASVDVAAAAPPAAGKVLTATSPTTAEWQTVASKADSTSLSGATGSTSYVAATGTVTLILSVAMNVLLTAAIAGYGPDAEDLHIQLTQDATLIGNSSKVTCRASNARVGNNNNVVVKNLAAGTYVFGLKFKSGSGGTVTIETGNLSVFAAPA